MIFTEKEQTEEKMYWPYLMSRHLVVPEPSQQSDSTDSMTPAQEEALRNQPNLIVFLHNALRSEGLCGLVQVAGGEEKEGRDSNNCAWFGILFSHSDKKSRSCLMLALFEPGETPVPWLGNLRRLGPGMFTKATFAWCFLLLPHFLRRFQNFNLLHELT